MCKSPKAPNVPVAPPPAPLLEQASADNANLANKLMIRARGTSEYRVGGGPYVPNRPEPTPTSVPPVSRPPRPGGGGSKTPQPPRGGFGIRPPRPGETPRPGGKGQ